MGLDKVYIIFRADDLGSSQAANAGIVRGFKDGLISQTNIMAPAPWFAQAARLVNEHGLPCGLHATLTCEYHAMTFGPLTKAPALCRDEFASIFPLGANELPADADEAVYAELAAQVERCKAAGMKLTHMDAHMGAAPRWDGAFEGAVARLYEAYGLRTFGSLEKPLPRDLPIDGRVKVGGESLQEKKANLFESVENLAPGMYCGVLHPAERSAEMVGMELKPGFAENRATDLELMLDKEVAERLEEMGIEVISIPRALELRGMR